MSGVWADHVPTSRSGRLGRVPDLVSVIRTFGTTPVANQRSAGHVWGLTLGGELAVLQAPKLDSLLLDLFALFDDGWGPAEVGVGGRHIIQPLVVTLVIVVLDNGINLHLKVAGQEVVFKQDTAFQGLVPAFDLALGLRMARCAAHAAHFPGLDVFRQFACDVAGAVIAEQPGLVEQGGAVTA